MCFNLHSAKYLQLYKVKNKNGGLSTKSLVFVGFLSALQMHPFSFEMYT